MMQYHGEGLNTISLKTNLYVQTLLDHMVIMLPFIMFGKITEKFDMGLNIYFVYLSIGNFSIMFLPFLANALFTKFWKTTFILGKIGQCGSFGLFLYSYQNRNICAFVFSRILSLLFFTISDISFNTSAYILDKTSINEASKNYNSVINKSLFDSAGILAAYIVFGILNLVNKDTDADFSYYICIGLLTTSFILSLFFVGQIFYVNRSYIQDKEV